MLKTPRTQAKTINTWCRAWLCSSMHRILTRGDRNAPHTYTWWQSTCTCNCKIFTRNQWGEFCSSLYMNFRIFNLDFEPEDKIKMGSCLRGVYRVFNKLSDDVSIVGIHHVDQKLWFFLNNKLWIFITQELMTSSWCNLCIFPLLVNI